MASHAALWVQAGAAVASLVVAGVAVWIAVRSTRAQEKGVENYETLVRIEEAREKQDLARFSLIMNMAPFDERTVLRRGQRTPLKFKLENSGNRGSDIRRVDVKLVEENGTIHRPAVDVLRADPDVDRADLFVEAGKIVRIDVFLEEDQLPNELRPSACRVTARVVPVRGEVASSEWGPTIGSAEWTKYL